MHFIVRRASVSKLSMHLYTRDVKGSASLEARRTKLVSLRVVTSVYIYKDFAVLHLLHRKTIYERDTVYYMTEKRRSSSIRSWPLTVTAFLAFTCGKYIYMYIHTSESVSRYIIYTYIYQRDVPCDVATLERNSPVHDFRAIYVVNSKVHVCWCVTMYKLRNYDGRLYRRQREMPPLLQWRWSALCAAGVLFFCFD